MEDVRYAASFAAGPSNKDKIKELGDKQQNLRHVKEKSEGAQELVQKIEGGLAHIGELLGERKGSRVNRIASNLIVHLFSIFHLVLTVFVCHLVNTNLITFN